MKPSQEFDKYWICAYSPTGTCFFSSVLSGKWIISADVSEIDDAWVKVKEALNAELLGPYAIVATMRESILAESPNRKVICVFTLDYTDIVDVLRVREHLREIGFTQELRYKTDIATIKDNYGPDSYLYTD